MKDQKPITHEIEDAVSQTQTRFKQLDLTIAYRALIQAFVQSDEIFISEIETEKQDENVYDHS